MKKQILTLIIGILIGAIITTGVFLIIKSNSSQTVGNMGGQMGEPPAKPGESTTNSTTSTTNATATNSNT